MARSFGASLACLGVVVCATTIARQLPLHADVKPSSCIGGGCSMGSGACRFQGSARVCCKLGRVILRRSRWKSSLCTCVLIQRSDAQDKLYRLDWTCCYCDWWHLRHWLGTCTRTRRSRSSRRTDWKTRVATRWGLFSHSGSRSQVAQAGLRCRQPQQYRCAS